MVEPHVSHGLRCHPAGGHTGTGHWQLVADFSVTGSYSIPYAPCMVYLPTKLGDF